MFWKCGRGAETPQFSRPIPAPFPPSPVADLRPCEVDGKTAVFHRWVDDDRALLRINTFVRPEEGDIIVRRFRETGIVSGGCSTEIQRTVCALVEYPDGSVGKVNPELVTFLDR